MFCYQCGKPIDDDAVFCPMCGARQTPVQQPQPGFSAPQAPQPAPAWAPPMAYYLYMDAKGLTLFNYKFDIRDSAGNLYYRAATVTEGMFTHHARVYYPNDAEAMAIHQQKKVTLAALNFDIVAPNGALVTEVLQKIHFTTTEFQLPQLGMVVTGDFFSTNFVFKRGEEVVCNVKKKFMSWGDSYELEFFDPNLDKILLAAVMVIQLMIAISRRRRH